MYGSIRSLLAALAAGLLMSSAAWAVPATVPVQGVLRAADGAPIAAELPVVFNLYADPDGQDLVWTEARMVAFDQGFFSIDLGQIEPLDAGLFRDHADGLWLGITIDGDAEMDPVALGTAPFAGFAQYAGRAAAAGDADTVGGRAADALAAADHQHFFNELNNVPPGLSDGDNDTTYAAGDGLALAGGAFALRACAVGQVLTVADAGWVCADGDALAPAVGAELVGTELIVTDGAAVRVVDLAALVADADADPANELLIGAALDGATLVLRDAGGETRVDLAALVPDSALSVTAAGLVGAVLTLERGPDPADALAVDLAGLVPADGDGDPGNELLQGAALDGTVLSLSDAGGVVRVDLAGLAPADEDGDPLNELLRSAALDGAVLTLTDAGGAYAVDLSPLIDDADADAANELIRSVAFDGARLTISDAGGDAVVDLSGLVDDADADPANELLTGAALNGTALLLEDAGGQRRIELASLVDDADADPANELLTGAALDGTTLALTDAGGQRRIELASLVDDADADPTNELQSLTFNRSTGVLGLTGTNTVDVFEGAFVLNANIGPSEDDMNFAESLAGDDLGQSVALPFTVRYSGVDYPWIYVSTNGWFEFQPFARAIGSDFFNQGLPTGNHAGPFVAAYWDDLTGVVSWSTLGVEPNRVFVIRFDGTRLSGGDPTDFTVQIHETSGVVAVRYLRMGSGASGQSATLGFQTAGGANAKAYPLGFNARVLDDNSSDADPGDQGWSVAPLR